MKLTLVASSLARSKLSAGPTRTVSRVGVEIDHVDGLGAGEPEPLALSDGVVGDAGVGAHHAPVAIHDRPWLEGVGPTPAQESPVVVVGDEAQLLALRGLRRRQTEAACVLPDLVLREVAHGKARRRKLLLGEGPEEVRLVLARVAAAPEQGATRRRVLRDARVVAGGHRRGVPGPRAAEK